MAATIRNNPVVTLTVGGLASVAHLRVLGWVDGLAPEVGSALIEALDGNRLNYGADSITTGAASLPNPGAAVVILANGVSKWTGIVTGVRFVADRSGNVRVLITARSRAIELSRRSVTSWQEKGGYDVRLAPTFNADGAGDMASSGNQSDRSGTGALWTARQAIETLLQRASVPLTLAPGGLLEYSGTWDCPVGDVQRQIGEILGTRSNLLRRVVGSVLFVSEPEDAVIANLTGPFIESWSFGYDTGGSWSQVRAFGQPTEVTAALAWERGGGGHLTWDEKMQGGTIALADTISPFGIGIPNVDDVGMPGHLLRFAGGVPVLPGESVTYAPAGMAQYPIALWVHRTAAGVNAPKGWSLMPASLTVLERRAGVRIECDDKEPLLIDRMVLVVTVVLPKRPEATIGGGLGVGLLPVLTGCRRAVVNADVPYKASGETLTTIGGDQVLVDTTEDLLRIASDRITAVGTARWSGGWVEKFTTLDSFPPGQALEGIVLPGRSLPATGVVTTRSFQNTEVGLFGTVDFSPLPDDDRSLVTRQVMA